MTLLGVMLLMVQVQLASVSGAVTKPGGNEPLPGAKVLLSPVSPLQNEQAIRSAMTQDDGRFVVEGIEPGDYRLTVESARYGSVSYGQRVPDGPSAILSLVSGQQVTGLRLSMVPRGTIAGRVTGRNGQPAVNASVQALRYSYRAGRRALVTVQATSTDDRGEYRLFWLPPGRYLVAANLNANVVYGGMGLPPLPGRNLRPGTNSFAIDGPPPELLVGEFLVNSTAVTRILEDGTQQEETWVPMYYPSSTDPRLATPVDVSAGATFTGVDFAIQPARAHRVRGDITGFIPGSTPMVTLQPQDLAGAIVARGASAADGSFGFNGVLPGVYYLTARDTRTGLASAPITVSVENRDVEGLVLGLTPRIRVEGSYRLEGTQRATAPQIDLAGRIAVWVQPDLPGAPVQVADQSWPSESEFVLLLPPGNYFLSVRATDQQPGATPLHLKSIRFAGVDAMASGLRVTASPEGRLEIVLTTETGVVEGAVRDTRGAVVPGATVVLVPDSGRKLSDRYKFATVGADGAFRFSDVVPGNYKLFAWNSVETGAWQDPDFLRPFEPRGRAVIVSGNSQSAVQVEVLDPQ